MKVKVLICGSSGKMGKKLIRLIKQNKRFLISGLINKKNYDNFTKSLVREQDKKEIDLSKLNKTMVNIVL